MEKSSPLHLALQSYESTLGTVREQLPLIDETGRILASAARRNDRIFIAGNGGSHSLAEHFCAELVGRLDHDASPIGAFVLQNCIPVNSALANDQAFESALARELEALARPGDVFIAISGSGESKNLLRAARGAKDGGLTAVCLVGNATSTLAEICHIQIVTPSNLIASVQQAHLVVVHLIWLALEQILKSDRPAD